MFLGILNLPLVSNILSEIFGKDAVRASHRTVRGGPENITAVYGTVRAGESF